MQRGGEAVDGGAFDLCRNAVGINRAAAIDGVNDTMNFHVAVVDADFRNSSCVGLKRVVSRDAAKDSGRQWLSPTRLLSGEFEHAFQARCVQRLALLGTRGVRDLALI